MAGKKKLSRARKSYNSYKSQYLEWKNKGYFMEKMLNFKSYKSQVFDLATKIGMKNIARETARASRSWTYSELSDIFTRIENKQKKDVKKIEGIIKRTKSESKIAKYEQQKEDLKNLLKKYSKSEILKNYSRREFFDLILEEYGGNYRIADRVIYG